MPPPADLRKHCAITADGEKLLETAVMRLGLSARAHDPSILQGLAHHCRSRRFRRNRASPSRRSRFSTAPSTGRIGHDAPREKSRPTWPRHGTTPPECSLASLSYALGTRLHPGFASLRTPNAWCFEHRFATAALGSERKPPTLTAHERHGRNFPGIRTLARRRHGFRRFFRRPDERRRDRMVTVRFRHLRQRLSTLSGPVAYG